MCPVFLPSLHPDISITPSRNEGIFSSSTKEKGNAMKRLLDYFTQGIDVNWKGRGTRMEVGIEVETSFVYDNGTPITREDSQYMFRRLAEKGRWSPVWPDRKSYDRSFIPELRLGLFRDKILYDLGRQNIEVATAPAQFDRTSDTRLIEHARS